MLAHSPFHQQPSQSAPQTVAPTTTVITPDASQQPPPPPAPQPPGTFQTLRLRDEPPPVTQPTRTSRKRKTPPNASQEPQQIPQVHQPPPGMMPPPPPGMVHHPPPHFGPGPPPMAHGFAYMPADYTPGGMPPPQGMPGGPPPPLGDGQQQQQQQQQQLPQQTSPGGAAQRPLSQSKRAEQNRKAQRAFRERRDQHVKALESRSQLLDAALASADEANRRWEECRALVDQLRVENAALRAALSQAQMLNANPQAPGSDPASRPPGPGEQSNSPFKDAPQSTTGTAEKPAGEKTQ